MAKRKPTNYLNNKDMLSEIHKSKCSYSYFDDPDKHNQFDIIIDNSEKEVKPSTPEWNEMFRSYIRDAKENRAKRISKQKYDEALEEFNANPKIKHKPKMAEFAIKPKEISVDELVFRIYTYAHIPQDTERKKTPKRMADNHQKLNFIPFKHYVLSPFSEDELTRSSEYLVFDKLTGTENVFSYYNTFYHIKEVGKSHWKDGEFCDSHGAITKTLAEMLYLLVSRYSERANWRGYSYVDEMQGQALLQLSGMCLMFDEAKSNNPFAYFTTSIANSFTRILNFEKKQQTLRDDLLEAQGKTPSFTRQLENDDYINQLRDEVID